MGLFDHALEDAVKIQAQIIHHQTIELSQLHEDLNDCKKKKPNPVHLALLLTISSNNSKLIIMAITLASNEKVIGTLSLIDSVTNADVPATFAGTTAGSDNTSIATAEVQADGTVLVKGIAAGSCTIVVASTASFTDSLGNAASGVVNSNIGATITAVQTADGVTLVVTFGAPQPQ